MRPPTRMRQVYDGGPPGNFRFPIKPLTVVFVAVVAFFVVHRFGVFSVDDDAVVPSRLDVVANELEVYYDRNPPQLGRVVKVHADSTQVHVDLLVSKAEHRALLEGPTELRSASLRAACPSGGDKLWDLISVNQSIQLHGRMADSTESLDVACGRYRR